MSHKKWSELRPWARAGIVAMSAIEFLLAGSAWIDLARRSPAQVRGRKAVWALAIAVNFVGPFAYFRWGRVAGSSTKSP